MLPGVGIARRRRVHYHGDVAAEHAHQHYSHSSYYAHNHHAAAPPPPGAATGVAGPALAARIRLEEKLRGAALPSRWSRPMRDGRSTTIPRHPQSTQRDEHDAGLPLPTSVDPEPEPELCWWPPAPPVDPAAALLQGAAAAAAADTPSPASASRRRRAELTRTLSKVDVCAVCLDEVRPDRRQRVTRLPCSHKYHSECVLPWLATHPDCPCCRALVPSADTLTLEQVGDS